MQPHDSPAIHLGRLLIVDDETELMTALCESLAKQGYKTAGFASGGEAIEALKGQDFDLVLTDLMMPEMDGIALLKAGLGIDPHLVGIVMTGQATVQTAVEAMKTGAFDYILKPFKLNALLPTLHRGMEVRRLRMENVQLQETVAIYDLTRAISFTLDLNVILNKVADAALQQCEADEVSIMLPTREGDELYVTVARGEGRGHILGERMPVARGVAGWVARHREALALHGEVKDPRFAPVRPRPDICSSISMPMMVGGKLVGVLNVNATRQRRPFTLGQMKALSILTGTAASALESAWLYTQVRESENRLEGLVRHLPEGVCLLGGDRRLILANPPAQDYLRALGGTEVGEALARLGGQDIEAFLKPRKDGLPHEIEVGGEAERIFEVAGRPVVEDAEGGWVLVIREVTQERKVQERIQRQYHLAAVGQLAAGIAHDFNNLLTGVIGFAQLVEMRPDVPEEARKDLGRIVSQGHQAAQMIRQILDFSRQRDVERRPVNVIPFLKETMKLLERTLPEDIRVETRFEGKEYIVQANLTQLQQIITNLAVNARDAMPEGGGLRVRLSHLRVEPGEHPPLPEMEAGDWVVWAISDTGAGMPPEVIKRIYEPFFTTKPPGEGTGLGLAQVYGIVRQHGGHIGVKSRVGEGTAFTIYLPRILGKGEMSGGEEVDLPRGRGETILVVEDESEVREVAGAILERLNYRVLTAMDGQEAQALYEAHGDEIALVLTDVVMPNVGGLELIRAIRKKDPEARIVAMTGYPPDELKRAFPSMDIFGWLEKPLSLDRVAQVISEALKGKG
ncbi:MAG: hypothetical protein A3F84_02075 [Candidatus Handelsmanbacteria bacterium RIFCSPLOWO2_12_FULL_64_10]|uniref:histidine kinase n=1 Tax=Handelsmanbacteria sp. (strain RIFCSPLOWO2_12_FULL_64_10) TaxID=1817868 RepID=A0A1F6D755_HANXR|nr:MAG: hypothetical protein A3F84_02075 [Candidatus Handelsmanbacteria bacterium RIFCSPLOWO2_12_FULL_64_10]